MCAVWELNRFYLKCCTILILQQNALISQPSGLVGSISSSPLNLLASIWRFEVENTSYDQSKTSKWEKLHCSLFLLQFVRIFLNYKYTRKSSRFFKSSLGVAMSIKTAESKGVQSRIFYNPERKKNNFWPETGRPRIQTWNISVISLSFVCFFPSRCFHFGQKLLIRSPAIDELHDRRRVSRQRLRSLSWFTEHAEGFHFNTMPRKDKLLFLQRGAENTWWAWEQVCCGELKKRLGKPANSWCSATDLLHLKTFKNRFLKSLGVDTTAY